MNVGDRVKLLSNVYENPDDSDMAPGVEGRIDKILNGDFIEVMLDKPVEGIREWVFVRSELEVIA
ncbi:hypothetical protein PJKIFABJ_00127 [Pseudomonas phage PE09]|uniref:Uncharacterized protein n=1 Tax=Pseudomonas phage PE09 TaxID=2696355 RepID=A0A9E6H4W5_9CAUD|nr:hypothetical protein QGX22_gp127 [Pseudomonas phage PE09]QHZ60063.1 hypothetical protein PJKIFABJ_00127 [Pseudomonas phage PE09]